MNLIKQLMKILVTNFTSHYGMHRRQQKEPCLWVLMYHRILPADDPRFIAEEPGMVVTPETFDMHLREIKKYFNVVSLRDWIGKKQSGTQLPSKACVITFDDGWLDNFEYALPLLKKHQVPATLFAVAEKIGTNFQFWPNIVMWLLFNGGSDQLKQHPLLGEKFPIKNYVVDKEFAADYILQLKQFSDAEIFSALDEINNDTHLLDKMPRALMNWNELKLMLESGLVDIGSHTCNHKRLTHHLSQSELQHEICESKNILEKHLNHKIDLFCFPNGDYNPASLELVEATYSAAVTTQKGIVSNNNFSLHELKRIGLHEQVSQTPKTFGARLSGIL